MPSASLLDLKLRQDPDGRMARKIVEQLSQSDGIFDDLQWMEANDGSTHLTTVRTGLPEGTWRQLYQGVQPSKSTTAQVRDACGIFEMRAEIDTAMPGLQAGGDAAKEFRFSEEASFRLTLKNQLISTLFYGNASVTPSKFTGIAARFSTSVAATAASGDNVIKAGGSGADNTSIYVVANGGPYLNMLYAKGSNAGFTVRDLGEQDSFDSNAARFRALHTMYGFNGGCTLGDWRGVVRIPNIDISELTKTGSTGADLVDLVVQAIEMLPEEVNQPGVKLAIYSNRKVRSFMRRQIQNRDNVWLGWGEVAGKKVMTFDDIPWRRCDSIVNDEALVP